MRRYRFCYDSPMKNLSAELIATIATGVAQASLLLVSQERLEDRLYASQHHLEDRLLARQDRLEHRLLAGQHTLEDRLLSVEKEQIRIGALLFAVEKEQIRIGALLDDAGLASPIQDSQAVQE